MNTAFIAHWASLFYICNMENIRVGYSKTWAWGLILAGIVIFLMHVYLITLTGRFQFIPLLVNVFLIFSGAMYFFRPYFELRESSIVVFAPIGPLKKSYTFQSLSDIVFEGDKVYIVSGERKTKVRVGKTMSDKNDWKNFEMKIRSSDLMRELHD